MHPTVVKRLLARAAALIVALTLSTAGWAECAGWQTTPEARMACCTDSGLCPMHGSSDSSPGSQRAVTQAQADSCCAASDTDHSPASAAFSMSLSAALVPSPFETLALVTAPPAALGAWRTHLPRPDSQVPRHVLLSVFLI